LQLRATGGIGVVAKTDLHSRVLVVDDFDATEEAILLNLGSAELIHKPFTITEMRDAVICLLAGAEDEESDTPRPMRYVPD
jgi:DNA-binding response OmpR family regulator